MKKIFVLAIFAGLFSISSAYADDIIKSIPNFKKPSTEMRQQREAAFEKRLGLTEEQKVKAREIRQNGHAKLKPIIEEIKSKKQEAKMIKMSRMAVQMQEEKLAVIDDELKVLEKKAHDIRKANMKEFESILTRKQKRILKDMKKEGRKKYHAEHPAQMPFKLQAPNIKK